MLESDFYLAPLVSFPECITLESQVRVSVIAFIVKVSSLLQNSSMSLLIVIVLTFKIIELVIYCQFDRQYSPSLLLLLFLFAPMSVSLFIV